MASREISRQQAPDTTPDAEHLLDADEGPAAGRWPKMAVAAVGVAWMTMAVLAVTVFRPELAGMKRAAERVPAIAGQSAPFVDPAGFGGESAIPSPSSPPAPGEARPAYTAKLTGPTGAAIGRPDARPSSTPQPVAPAAAPSAPVAVSSRGPSGGSAHQGLPSSVSTCSLAASGSPIGSIIKDIQACASGLVSP